MFHVVSGYHSPVSQDIRVGGLPHQRTKLHDGDEAAEVLHFLSLILPVHHPRQIEELGTLQVSHTQHTLSSNINLNSHSNLWTGQVSFMSQTLCVWSNEAECDGVVYLVDFSPEAMFEVLLGLPQRLVVLE